MRLESDVWLAPRTTLGLGGKARHFVEVHSEQELLEALTWGRERRLQVRVLGGGSNVVIPDRGLDGLVVAIGLRGIELQRDGSHCNVSAFAGEAWDELVSHCVEAGLWGLECLSGIPGCVGATPIQNVGAYGQEVKDTLTQVRAFDTKDRAFVVLDASACEFGYRDSRFKRREPERYIVTQVSFCLDDQQRRRPLYAELDRALANLAREPSLRDVRETVLDLRRRKSMLLDANDENARSCGSFFVNPVISEAQANAVQSRFGDTPMPRFAAADGLVKLSAAWLIERSGFVKGQRSGNVGISTRHALALVCHEGASSQELMDFAEAVRAAVRERTSVELSPEPVIWT